MTREIAEAHGHTADCMASVEQPGGFLCIITRAHTRHYMCTALSLPTHKHTNPFNGPLSGTTRVSRYQKGKTDLDFTEARDSKWQWHQLGHM